MPHRIEHAQLVRSADFARFAAAGVVASMQPLHATADLQVAQRHWGLARTGRAYAWRSLLDAGAPVAFGSDAPVESIAPLDGIAAAVSRGWHAEQRVSVFDAVAAYSGSAALAAGWRDVGALAVGSWCDATVIDLDPAEHDLGSARVVGTVTSGVVRFAAGIG